MTEPAPQLPPIASEGGPEVERRMPFLDHLQELRSCLRNSAIAVLAMTVVAYLVRGELFALLARPLMDAWDATEKETGLGNPGMVFTSPAEPFMVMFKLAMMVGVFLSTPVIFRELWKFISPGLYARERKWGLAFVVISVALFIGGGIFCYSYVLPASYKYFLGYSSTDLGLIKSVFGKHVDVRLAKAFAIRPMITMDEYMGLTTSLLLVFGAVFELPLVLSVLAMLGIVSAKQLWSFNRYAVIVFAVLGAVLTPGDMVYGQLMMTGALMVLYNLSIVLALMVGRPRKEDDVAPEPT